MNWRLPSSVLCEQVGVDLSQLFNASTSQVTCVKNVSILNRKPMSKKQQQVKRQLHPFRDARWDVSLANPAE